MICSVLICSRGRPKRLLETIESVQWSCNNLDAIEVLVRIDDDDEVSKSVGEWDSFKEVADEVVIGPRLGGYGTLNILYTELANIAKGDWVWCLNDDATVEGKDWDLKLADVPLTGFIVQPETIINGGSTYVHCEGGPFPIVPRNSWLPDWPNGFVDPLDTKLDQLLRIGRGWSTHFLPGITVNHQRDNDEVLALHRKL